MPPAMSPAGVRHAVDVTGDDPNADTLTEVLRSALRGLITLDGPGHLRPDIAAERLRLFAELSSKRGEE